MRTHYHNGDKITLGDCDGCNPAMINGVLCHETGCPEAWRDRRRECPWCSSDFYPEDRGQRFCSQDCADAYYL